MRISKDNLIIVRGNRSSDLSSAAKMLNKAVYSEKSRKIGRISEIFGPVAGGAYFSIKPLRTAQMAKMLEKKEKLIGSGLYMG